MIFTTKLTTLSVARFFDILGFNRAQFHYLRISLVDTKVSKGVW